MSLIDTHAHLYAEQFDEDRDAMLKRAFAAGVTRVYLPNVDSQSIEGMLALEAQYPDKVFAMMGLHPCSVKADTWEKELNLVEKWLKERRFCAVGEIGMDLYWDQSTKAIQEEAFKIQCKWAVQYHIPIVIHSREAIDPLLDIIEEEALVGLRGIFHCFSGTIEQAQRIIANGLYLGIGGPLTYKKSTLPDILAKIPLNRMVLETDAPYLPPTPHRGKRNESAYVLLVAQKLAEIKSMDLNQIIQITGENALNIFS